MHIILREILAPMEVAEINDALAAATYVSGLETAGLLAARVKNNLQISAGDETGRRPVSIVRRALARSRAFSSAALPKTLSEPRLNRYEIGMSYGDHVDHAVMGLDGASGPMRSDLAATLFLGDPDRYDGGELVIGSDVSGPRIKLPAGDLLLYPASTVHRVEPVTRGRRDAAIFWIQSMIRSDERRTILFDLDRAITSLGGRDPSQSEIVTLSAVYHNLLRQWAEP